VLYLDKKRVIILGAGGRDFHNFLVCFKDNPGYEVVCFTAAQIPGIEKRKFPKELAGRLYKKDIPIYPEEKISELIKKFKIDEVVLAYSDLSHEEVMHKASIVLAAGASFKLLGPKETMLRSNKKVISVCAVRTGAGKSQTSRAIGEILKKHGKKAVAVRHPMPYGNLKKQVIERFSSYKDLKKYETTIDFEKDSSVVSADPKIVTEGLDEIKQISYNEARLAGMFGMKILDPIAIKEILEHGVDMSIIITDMKNPRKTTISKGGLMRKMVIR
jgi:predicted GTPase